MNTECDECWESERQALQGGKVIAAETLRQGGNGCKLKTGSKISMTWELGKGATHMAPWGRYGTVPQTLVR